MDYFDEQATQTTATPDMQSQEAPETTKALEQCQSQLLDIKNKYLRIVADLDNYRKRQEREQQQWSRIAQMDVLTPLLTIIDDFDRALTQKKETVSPEISTWLEGFELIHKELIKYLDKLGVQEIVTAHNEQFNPELHESIMSVESELPAGTIVTALQKGYTFKGFVLRPAKVSIAR